MPKAAFGNTSPILPPESSDATNLYRSNAPLLAANLCSLALDYVARQKIQSTHLNWYILEQLPIAPADSYARRFGPQTAAEIVRDDVLHLTYTAHDMAGFARDQGYNGLPFRWDDEDRFRRRARLDALFCHLYGLDREERPAGAASARAT